MEYNVLLAAKYAELVRRALGEDVELTSVGPELLTAIILENDPPEFWYLRGKKGWHTRSSVNAAGAGIRSEIQVFNPADSNQLSVVLGFIPQPQVGGTFETDLLLKTQTALATLSGRVFLSDYRPGITAQGSGATQLRTKNAGALTAAADIIAALVVSSSQPIIPLYEVLAPGTGLILVPNADNTGIAGGFFGYERSARAEELAVS